MSGDENEPITPTVGMPATIHLYKDALPAVVVKVNPKSVVVAPVAHIESTERRINNKREPLPCLAYEADLSQVIGRPARYTRGKNGRYSLGSYRLTLGKAVKITDYRE